MPSHALTMPSLSRIAALILAVLLAAPLMGRAQTTDPTTASAKEDPVVVEIRNLLNDGKYQEAIKRCNEELAKDDSGRLRFYLDYAEGEIRALKTGRTTKGFDSLADRLKAVQEQQAVVDDSPIITDEVLNEAIPTRSTGGARSRGKQSPGLLSTVTDTFKQHQQNILYGVGGLVGLIVLLFVFKKIRARRASDDEDEEYDEDEDYDEEDEDEEESLEPESIDALGGMASIDDKEEMMLDHAPAVDEMETLLEEPLPETVETPEQQLDDEPESEEAPQEELGDLDISLDFLSDTPTTETPEAEEIVAPVEEEPTEEKAPIEDSEVISFDDIGLDFEDTPTVADEPPVEEQETVTLDGQEEADLDLSIDFDEPIALPTEEPTSDPALEETANSEFAEDIVIPEAATSDVSTLDEPVEAPTPPPPADANDETVTSPFDDLSLEETIAIPSPDLEPFTPEEALDLDAQLSETLPTAPPHKTEDIVTFSLDDVGDDPFAAPASEPGAEEDAAAEEDEMYNEQMTKGDEAAANGDWQTAAHHYNVASAINPDSTAAADKLAEARRRSE